MARATTPAIPIKMYRHFAVVTIALTAMLALIADGENRGAVSEHLAKRQRDDALRRESYARFGPPKVGGEGPADVGQFRSDDAFGEFGAPMDSPTGGARSSVIPAGDVLLQAGYSQAYIDSLDPHERRLILAGLENAGMATAAQRQQRSEALMAASARRSGLPTAAE